MKKYIKLIELQEIKCMRLNQYDIANDKIRNIIFIKFAKLQKGPIHRQQYIA